MKQLLTLFILCLFISGCKNPFKPTKGHYPALVLIGENEHLKHNKVEEGGIFSDDKFDGWILTGDIRNNDGTDIYKDIVVSLEYKDKAGHILNTQKITLYKTVAPGTTLDLNEKVYPPAEMETFSISVVNATLANPEQ